MQAPILQSLRVIKHTFLLFLFLLLAGVAFAQRVPTGQFDPGLEFYKIQVLTGNLETYVPENVYTAAIERSQISTGNTARLRRVMQKAEDGEPIVIGFIGGSITQGAGTSVTKNPDVVLIEFAVNDIGLDTQTIPYMEGLIRKAFDLDNDPAVMLLFMMSSMAAESAESYPRPWQAMNGEVFEYDGTAYGLNVQNYQIPLGQHYELPMISFRDAVFPLLTGGYLGVTGAT